MRITEGIVNVSVRELVELVMRSGSINASFVSRARAVEGTRAHRKIQEMMDENYEKEVKLVHECQVEELTFVVEGRADGIITDLIAVTIDEIKSTRTSLDLIDEAYNPLHWAQARCYAYFYAKANGLKDMNVRLTYYNLDTKETKHLIKVYNFQELEDFFMGLLTKYARWIKFYMDWSKERTSYLKELTFPFPQYRAGQREMAVYVYKSIVEGEKLYVNAPTGIGKTISTLFPALKAMGEGYGSKIFYLTAKTITRTVAEKSIRMIYEGGTRIKSITLTAKDKICFCEERNCHPDFCQYAEGHFDRVDEAVYEIINSTDLLTREVIEAYAKKYCVCPFELSLDLAIYADIVVCDYNYVFDPTVALKRFLDQKDFLLLVDEAHNLVDRAREMYSESLSKKQILQMKRAHSKQYPTVAKCLGKINDYFVGIRKDYVDVTGSLINKESPSELYKLVRQFINECDRKLQKGAMHKLPQDLLELYFRAYNFTKIYEFFDDHYVTYGEQTDGDLVLKMFCIDPSYIIGNIVSTCRSVIFFSATLMPIEYFKYMLAGEGEKAINLPSPFEAEKALRLITTDVSTRYQHRESSYEKISDYIQKVITAKKGNYMIFFPSYHYMNKVYEDYISRYGDKQVVMQDSQMDEEAREDFLNQFKKDPTSTRIGFCVLGGIFSEGIDLTEDRLIGVIVVGVGLPQIGLERDLIKYHFEAQEKEGYHYAYTYPGMNKVLQAVGRLIRTERDEGVILLIDDRFHSHLYESLMPEDFHNRKRVNKNTISQQLEQYWESRC